ncbi:MAG TPA: serine hydrolase domain-containing protein [Acidimicrobiales bacterium]|nr:serine hydrolase domain-containing protein [Acidimicrobiales bacterium]
MADVHGFCDERFRPLEDAFRANLDSGLDKGASLAVKLHGEPVVDLWGGTRDYEITLPWEADTVVRVFSTSKVMVMIMILMLVDRGHLDLDEPIATYWPEFAKHGKGTITTRQVLIHQSGLPGYGRSVTFEELGDRRRSSAIIEDAELWFDPGTASCYHAQTFGDLLAGVIERTSGFPFEEFHEREIAVPLAADFHFGLPVEQAGRVSALWPAKGQLVPISPMAERVIAEFLTQSELIDPDLLPTAVASLGGITNARALAHIGSIIAMNGEVDGRRYLSSAIIAEAGTEQSHADDLAVGWVRYGLGFGLHTEDYPAPTPTTMHWGGYGGSFITMDPASGVSCGFAQSQLLLDGGPFADRRRVEFWRLLGEITATL